MMTSPSRIVLFHAGVWGDGTGARNAGKRKVEGGQLFWVAMHYAMGGKRWG